MGVMMADASNLISAALSLVTSSGAAAAINPNLRPNERGRSQFVVTSRVSLLDRGPGMIEIILTVCAIANPANCEEKYLQFVWDGSINQCMMAAQPYIAQWIGKHPQCA